MQLELNGNAHTPAGATYAITFDGGSLGNPGVGYGSYAIEGPNEEGAVRRLKFSESGEIVTNNQAEYRTLIVALEELSMLLGDAARQATVTIHGDSKLVIEQVAGRWKVKNAELKVLAERARDLVRAFGRVNLVWHPRSKSVDTLGH